MIINPSSYKYNNIIQKQARTESSIIGLHWKGKWFKYKIYRIKDEFIVLIFTGNYISTYLEFLLKKNRNLTYLLFSYNT